MTWKDGGFFFFFKEFLYCLQLSSKLVSGTSKAILQISSSIPQMVSRVTTILKICITLHGALQASPFFCVNVLEASLDLYL